MHTDDPPITFVAIWGAFALLMLVGQTQLVARGSTIPASYQLEMPGASLQLAALD